jgi:hypothetical protein
MSDFKSAFDADVKLSSSCGCGHHASPDERAADASVIGLGSASGKRPLNPGTADYVSNAPTTIGDDNLCRVDLGSAERPAAPTLVAVR